jgi:hypothetical protein
MLSALRARPMPADVVGAHELAGPVSDALPAAVLRGAARQWPEFPALVDLTAGDGSSPALSYRKLADRVR